MQAVVFDLDDTLYPERDFVLGGFRAVADWAEARLRIPAAQGFEELWRLFESGVRGNTFDRWLEGREIDADGLIPQMVHVYREHHHLEPPTPEHAPDAEIATLEDLDQQMSF